MGLRRYNVTLNTRVLAIDTTCAAFAQFIMGTTPQSALQEE